MKNLKTLGLLLLLIAGCKQNQNDNTNLKNDLINKTKVESKEVNQINADAEKAAKISLQFDAIQPLSALTGDKEQTNKLKELNKEYKGIEDKYIENKTAFTELVGNYRTKLQSK